MKNLSPYSSSLPTIPKEQGCSLPSKWLLVPLVGTAAGLVFVTLAALQFFGPPGSIAFIATIAGGGTLTLISLGGGTWLVIKGNKKRPVSERALDYHVKGGDINTKDASGLTPLHKAVLNNDLEMVAYLVQQRGINLNELSRDQRLTALHLAVRGENNAIVAILVAIANVNMLDENSKTALHHAVENQNKVAIELLLHHEANVRLIDRSGRTPLQYAEQQDDPMILNLFNK